MAFGLDRLSLRRRSDEAEADAVTAASDSGLKPSTMRGNEGLYGYLVGVELLIVAVLNLTVTHGPGAPAHPQTALAAVGVVVSLAFMAVLRTKNRFVAGLGVIVAAFFVTLPRVPNSLSLAHVFALVIPLAYGLILTQRQRKATPRAARGATAARAGKKAPSGRAAATESAPSRRGRRRSNAEATPAGPRPSARYTPPKSKRKATK